ncbi:MAG: cystathionine beta-lyase [Rhodothalassiaceae bacterium]
MRRKTRLATLGRRADWTHGIVNPPVYRASTVLFDTYAQYRDAVTRPDDTLYYGRRGTPTHWALKEALTELHGGAGTWLFPSGVAAVNAAILAFAGAGDQILVPDNAYEPSRMFANRLAKRFGIDAGFYDPCIGADIAGQITDKTRVILIESPGSLTFEVQDVPAIAAAAKARGVVTVADNTWATPLLFRPLEHGVDVAVEACTKYITGHSDVMMGSATAAAGTWPKLIRVGAGLGQTVSPDDAWLALRGLRTLELRLQAHEAAALDLARWLAEHPLVAEVLHPALPSCPGHDLWRRDFDGASGVFALVLHHADKSALPAMTDQMRHFKMGFSWGGYESLMLPADPAPIRTATDWSGKGELIRLQVGLEDVADLKQDLADGLDRFARAAGLA